jgi:hypothetical protein
VGGVIASKGAKSAAKTQANAANRAADIGQQQFDTITQQEQPYMQSGYGALSQLNYLLGIPEQGGGQGGQQGGQTYDMSRGEDGSWAMNPDGTMGQRMVNAPGGGGASGVMSQFPGGGGSNPGGFAGAMGTMIGRVNANQGMTPSGQIVNQPGAPPSGVTGSQAGGFGSLTKPFSISDFYDYSPAYQFQKQQGTQGVLNASAAGQGALSGAAQKDLIGYNQSLAGTSFNNAFNQYQTQQGNIFNRLSGVAQLGQTAAANTGQQGTALTGQIGQSVTNAGTAAAAGQVGSANAWSGALSSAAPWLAGAASRYGGNSSAGTDWTGMAAAAGVS